MTKSQTKLTWISIYAFALSFVAIGLYLWNDIGGTASGGPVEFDFYAMSAMFGAIEGAVYLVIPVTGSDGNRLLRILLGTAVVLMTTIALCWTVFIATFEHSWNW